MKVEKNNITTSECENCSIYWKNEHIGNWMHAPNYAVSLLREMLYNAKSYIEDAPCGNALSCFLSVLCDRARELVKMQEDE